MFIFHVIQADEGDCFLLEYGSMKKPRFMLIDGGPGRIFEKSLRAVLEHIKRINAELDVAVLTHIDDDHLDGLIKYFLALQKGDESLPKLKNLWFNAYNGMEGNKSITGGEELRSLAESLNISRNEGFPEGFITVESSAPLIKLENLEIVILGPTRHNLEKLSGWWLARGFTDPWIPNLSSIMFLVRSGEKTLLLAGDGRGDHLLDSLSQRGLLDLDGKIHVDILKMPHHGSNRVMKKEVLEKVTADTYVISANGKYDNPNIYTLSWIVEAAYEQGRKISIFITNKCEPTEELTNRYSQDKYGYMLRTLSEGKKTHSFSLQS